MIMLPATMLGCVYYSWTALEQVRWLQVAVLANPVVYMSEGLRAVLTPQVPHMSYQVFVPVLLGGAGVDGVAGGAAVHPARAGLSPGA